ncbi:hypothetical protein NL676_025806 [Syzygium grande]|nr:hypothetical protein NL676_025806 [Syzygium grande]
MLEIGSGGSGDTHQLGSKRSSPRTESGDVTIGREESNKPGDVTTGREESSKRERKERANFSRSFKRDCRWVKL